MYRITAAYRSLRRNHGQTFAVLGGIMLYILFGLLLWWGLDKYIQPTSSTEKKDLMQAVGLILAGVAGGVGIYFTWRNLRLTQESLQITEQGQITERFIRALDQIGARDNKGNIHRETRLGAVYALGEIMRHLPSVYGGPILEVLTAYIRDNASKD